VRTAYIIGCISHGFNHATNVGAVLLSYELFLKNIRTLYFLSLFIIYALCSLQLSAASAYTVTVTWDKNPETDVIGYKFHYGIMSKNYRQTVDLENDTNFSISGLDEGTT